MTTRTARRAFQEPSRPEPPLHHWPVLPQSKPEVTATKRAGGPRRSPTNPRPAMASASAAAAHAGARDPRPRLLLELLDDCLPLPDAGEDLRPPRRPADHAYAADAVRAHGLLAERDAGGDPALREEWRAAVDAWVGRLLQLMDSEREHSRWVGTSFLGLTFQECCDQRFINSYSAWFQKVLDKMKAPSYINMVNMSTCVAMYDLFVRLSSFSNLKNEATNLAKKVVKPSLQLLDENGPVTEKAADLLGLIMKLFPTSVYRDFKTVESIITKKIMSGQYNLQQSKKLASTLALLPCVRISKNSMSLMIQNLLTVVNNLLNDTFLGPEEGHTDPKMLLAPPGSKLVPSLGGGTIRKNQQTLSTTKPRAYVVTTISALIHCCSVMLTSSYPIQVTNIPVHALLTLIQKVLLIDGSLHKSLFQSNTPFYQEFICSEIPTLHSTCLDLLASTIKGMRSSLIPHAGIVVMVISEYFNRTKLPAIRRKLYTVVRLLLSSMGVGMVMQLLQVVISNVFYDLNDNSGRSLLSACIDPVKTIILSPSKSSSNVEQRHQVQSSTVTSSESICNSQIMSPLCAKIGALETLEVLLNVGGSFRAYSWRAEMDLLLVNVARNAFYKAGMYEQRQPWTEEPSISVFQLASLKALLASFLSSPHERHPYLEQGLELFNRGMLETGTELGNFCAHALLNLDVLIHPRQFAPQRVAHSDIGLRSGGLEQSVLGSDISQPPCSGHKGRTTDDLGVSIAEEPSAKRIAVEKNAPAEGGQAGPVPGSSWIDINMEDDSWCNLAGFDALCDLPDSFSVYPAPINITIPDSRNPGDEIPNKKSACQGGILSSDACSSQNVPALTSPILAATSVSGPEWDPLDSLFNVGGADADIPTWLESPKSD